MTVFMLAHPWMTLTLMLIALVMLENLAIGILNAVSRYKEKRLSTRPE